MALDCDRNGRHAQVGGIAADRLRSLIERIERLEEERKALGSDIKDIYAEAKSAGFDVKVMRQLITLRKQEPAEVEEQETPARPLSPRARHVTAGDLSLATRVHAAFDLGRHLILHYRDASGAPRCSGRRRSDGWSTQLRLRRTGR